MSQEATNYARFIRIAPRKTRLVVSLIRGMRVEEARAQLRVSLKNAATPVLKALDAAAANAAAQGLDVASCVVTKALVEEGPKFKRFTPRAQGRATPIRRRTSHILLTVGKPINQ
jgi:large subunit ribosomal protein L22